MRYTDDDTGLGFSFELPDGWRVETAMRPLAFFGPNGRIGGTTEVIQMQVGQIAARYQDPRNREQFMAEPGAAIRRGVLGSENNVVICEWANRTEMSAVHDGVHYSFSYPNDPSTQEAVCRIQDTFQFPSAHQTATVMHVYSDPAVRAKVQTVSQVMHAGSAQEAHRLLVSSGIVESIERGEGATTYQFRQQRGREARPTRTWWQFWRR